MLACIGRKVNHLFVNMESIKIKLVPRAASWCLSINPFLEPSGFIVVQYNSDIVIRSFKAVLYAYPGAPGDLLFPFDDWKN